MGNNHFTENAHSKKNYFDGYLNRHEYPSILFRFPNLIHLLYFWNHLMLQRNWAVRSSVSKYFPQVKHNAKVVDAGCGEGMYILPFLKKHPGTTFIGIDKNQNHISFCKNYAAKNNLGNASFIYRDLEKEISTKNADLLLCVGTLQYVANDTIAITNFYSALKKNGNLIIYTPINGKTILPVYRYFFLKNKHYEKSQNRKRVYTEKEIMDKLITAGFKISGKKYTYGKMGIIAHEVYSLLLMGISNSGWFSVIFIIGLFCFLPLILALNFIDHFIKKGNGNGLLVIAKK